MTDMAPGYLKKTFECPHCNTVTNHWWGELLYEHTGFRLSAADISICGECHGQSIWVVDRHADPQTATRVHPA
jgi:transcription elongation factor Elf1